MALPNKPQLHVDVEEDEQELEVELSSAGQYENELGEFIDEQLISEVFSPRNKAAEGVVSPRAKTNEEAQAEEDLMILRLRLKEINAIIAQFKAVHSAKQCIDNTKYETKQITKKLDAYERQPTGFLFYRKPKVLTADQIAEFTMAKEMIKYVKTYVTKQANVDFMLSALSNVTRSNGQVIQIIPNSPDREDEDSSLTIAINKLRKGKSLPAIWQNALSNKTGTIKDKTILRILSNFTSQLEQVEIAVRIHKDGVSNQVKNILIDNINLACSKLSKADAQEVSRQGYGGTGDDPRLPGLLNILSQADYVNFSANIKQSLDNYGNDKPKPKTDEPKPETKAGPHHRRSAW